MEKRGFEDGNALETKGKGKAKDDAITPSLISPKDVSPPNVTRSSPHPESALARVAMSSASLTSSIMSSRSPGQYSANILPSSKPESSRASQHSATVLQETTLVTHDGPPNVPSTLGNTFRSTNIHTRTNGQDNSFSSFLGTTKDSSGPSGANNLDQTRTSHVTHGVAAAMNDGSEVVNLLETQLIEEDYDDDYRLHITAEEVSALRKALFGDKPSTGTGWNDVLNFVPDFISHGDGAPAYRQLANHLGVSDTAEARDVWFAQWGDVLSSYTDEVWGDLGPLVAAARQEIQRISNSPEGTTHQLNAVRRLQQILTHMRDSH
ncbi:hypothetical protein GGS21DRAFT_308977 [Xylaria nigripes]|nr:hypothetical protein GGS21DRAFT_308977 [Xylaria nigripes]